MIPFGGGSVKRRPSARVPGGILLTRVVLAVVLALVLMPQAISASAPPYAPEAVLAIKLTDRAFVTWVPGDEAPDFYNVYGITDHGRELLNSTTADADTIGTLVPVGFRTYGVTGVKNGVESPMRMAIGSSGDDPQGCIQIVLQPEPGFTVRCLPIGRVEVMWNDTELTDSLL